MSELHLACAADAAYVPHSAAMLHSAITRGGRPLCIHYLHGPGFSPEDMAKLGEMLTSRASKIVFHEIPDRRLRGLPLDHRFGPAMWYRVFLPELLPDIPRILYLDIDTLVIEPLDQLWDTALDGCYLAAVTNVFMGYHRRHAAELGLELTDYFNSGVVLFNLDLMRARDFAGALIDLVRRRGPQLLWPDQDAFNLTAASSWARLHPRWNVMNSFTSRPRLARETFGPKALTEALAHPAIRHFEGPATGKPWHAGHERWGRELYRRHRLATPWPELALEASSPLDRAGWMVARARDRGRALRRRVTGQP